MNFTLLKSSSSFAAIDCNEEKVKESLANLQPGQEPMVELIATRNFPVDDATGLSAAAKKKVMYDRCAGSRTRNKQLHFAVSCKGKTNTIDELKDAAIKLLDDSGYGKCPTLIYAHRDTDDLHVHVITTTVNEYGRKIKDFRNATRFAKQLAEYQKSDIQRNADDVIKEAMSYHFTNERQFSKILEFLGMKSGHREEKVAPVHATKKDGQKSVWADNPHFLFLYRYKEQVARVAMRDITQKAAENKRRIAGDTARETRRIQLAAIMLKKRQEEMKSFYSGEKALDKTQLRIIQKVRALDRGLEHRMAQRGIMRNDLFQMELFRLEMRKKFGVVVNYNYDKTGVPNGFIAVDPQSKSVWKGEELGFKFRKFLRPDEKLLGQMIEQGRHLDYEAACQQHPGELVALQVRDSDGNPVYLFYGENVASLLPPNLGVSNSYGETPRRILNTSDMQRLAGQDTKVCVAMSYYDAIPKEKLYDIELQDTNVRSTYKKTLDEIGMLQYPYIPKGFIRASPPYLSQGVFVMNVESIGGRAPKYAVRELDKNDVAAYKNGEMLLEELVLKYYHKEVREALERSFHSTCDEKGTGLGLPTFTLPLSLSGINELFCEMSDTANSIVDNSLGNGFQPVGSGITAGSGKSLGKRKKKRRGDDSDEGLSSGMHY